jgi:hypothetical protein
MPFLRCLVDGKADPIEVPVSRFGQVVMIRSLFAEIAYAVAPIAEGAELAPASTTNAPAAE